MISSDSSYVTTAANATNAGTKVLVTVADFAGNTTTSVFEKQAA
jgi:hypothetical protein